MGYGVISKTTHGEKAILGVDQLGVGPSVYSGFVVLSLAY
jgi:hypothetical protein